MPADPSASARYLSETLMKTIPIWSRSGERLEEAKFGLEKSRYEEEAKSRALQDQIRQQQLERNKLIYGEEAKQIAQQNEPLYVNEFLDTSFKDLVAISQVPFEGQTEWITKQKEWAAGLIPKIGKIFGARYDPSTKTFISNRTGSPITKREFNEKQQQVLGMIALHTDGEKHVQQLAEAGSPIGVKASQDISKDRTGSLKAMLEKKRNQYKLLAESGMADEETLKEARKGLESTELALINSYPTDADKMKAQRDIMKYNKEMRLLDKKEGEPDFYTKEIFKSLIGQYKENSKRIGEWSNTDPEGINTGISTAMRDRLVIRNNALMDDMRGFVQRKVVKPTEVPKVETKEPKSTEGLKEKPKQVAKTPAKSKYKIGEMATGPSGEKLVFTPQGWKAVPVEPEPEKMPNELKVRGKTFVEVTGGFKVKENGTLRDMTREEAKMMAELIKAGQLKAAESAKPWRPTIGKETSPYVPWGGMRR